MSPRGELRSRRPFHTQIYKDLPIAASFGQMEFAFGTNFRCVAARTRSCSSTPVKRIKSSKLKGCPQKACC